jgi:ABC-type multidrug transport system fused ATPase/permease subunit
LRDFFRAFSYVTTYKHRLGLCVVLCLLMAVLYWASIGAMLPMFKVLIGREGVHGWVRRARADTRLDAVIRTEPEEVGRGLPVVGLSPRSPLVAAGLPVEGPPLFLIRVGDVSAEGADNVRPALERLLEHPPGAPLDVAVRRGGVEQTIAVEPIDDGRILRLAAWAVSLLPEGGPDERFRALTAVALLLIGIAAFTTVLRFLQEYMSGWIASRAVLDLQCEAVDALLRQSMAAIGRDGVHGLLGRFSREYDELRTGMGDVLSQMLREPVRVIAAVAAALMVNWKLTLLIMCLVPPSIGIIQFFGVRMRGAAYKALAAAGKLTAVVQEVLMSMRVIKAFGAEGRVRRRFLQAGRENFAYLLQFARMRAVAGPVIEFMTQLAAAAVAIGGAWMVFRSGLSPEEFFGYLFCLFAISEPIRRMSAVTGRMRRTQAAAQRVFEMMDRPTEAQETARDFPAADTRDCAPPRIGITFEKVSFAYGDDGIEAVREVDLTIRTGETVAFVGPNGSGKTTLLSLLPRLYLPTRGRILWDGVDLREFVPGRLRRQIGLVTQDAVIFKGTVLENIALGDLEADRAAVIEAARKARADEFIVGLRDAAGNVGYDAVLAEHGHSLSGGQRQRIALARAILRDPSVLILDEATSQIDSRAEALIHEALVEFSRGRTTLVIAHRLSTVQHADRIVVMDAGSPVAVGTHSELLSGSGLYRALCERQFLSGAAATEPAAAAAEA